LEHLLFAAYLIFFAWLVTRVKFFRNSGLSSAQLIIFFLLKVLAGIFYAWIGVYYGEMAQMVDTWAYHYESLKEYALLTGQPSEFFTNIITSTYEEGYAGFLTSKNSWWNDLKGNIFLKLLAIFNVFSFGNYYVNVIFYSFLTLVGPMALYRVMKSEFPKSRTAVMLATFLVPSFLYWTSGIHKDGIIFLGFAMAIYHIHFMLRSGSLSLTRTLWVLLGLCIVVVLRNSLIIVLVPALLAWIVATRVPRRPLLVFAALYTLFLIFFFSAKFFHPSLDFPQAVSEKQAEFRRLSGGSAIEVNTVSPTIGGFVWNAPQAFTVSTLRPYPSDVRHLLSLAAAAEINALLLLLVLSFAISQGKFRPTPYSLFCTFLAFSILMMIGYSVNFLGAIVRYRSIILPFLVVPMVARIDWQRLKALSQSQIIIKDYK
jgi:hypothetical protein